MKIIRPSLPKVEQYWPGNSGESAVLTVVEAAEWHCFDS